MVELVVVVGLSATGKTHSVREACRLHSGIQRFSSDAICRDLRSLFNISHFSNADSVRWAKMETLGNVPLARYWLFSMVLRGLTSEVCLADGYRLLFPNERQSLEDAMAWVWPSARITYVHLRPGQDRLNCHRTKRGFAELSAARYARAYDELDLSFVQYEIEDPASLPSLLTEKILGRRKTLPSGIPSRIDLQVDNKPSGTLDDIDYVTRSYRSRTLRFFLDLRFVRRIRNALKPRNSPTLIDDLGSTDQS